MTTCSFLMSPFFHLSSRQAFLCQINFPILTKVIDYSKMCKHYWQKLNRRSQHLSSELCPCLKYNTVGRLFFWNRWIYGLRAPQSVNLSPWWLTTCLSRFVCYCVLSGNISVTAPLPPFLRNKSWKRLEIQPQARLIKAAIQFLKTPGQLQAKYQFSLSVHKAIWLSNNLISSCFCSTHNGNHIRETTTYHKII